MRSILDFDLMKNYIGFFKNLVSPLPQPWWWHQVENTILMVEGPVQCMETTQLIPFHLCSFYPTYHSAILQLSWEEAALIVQFSDPDQLIAKFMKSVTRSIFIFDWLLWRVQLMD